MFKTETHLHVAEVSRCGKIRAAEMIRLYHEAGYSTVFVADHFYQEYFDSLGELSWEDKVTVFLSGYYRAKEAGKKYGMNILMSAEFAFPGSANHYLAYGLTREFLNTHPDLPTMDIETFYRIACENGLFIVQAHPFRDDVCHPTPEYVHGIEVYNSNPRHNDFSEKSIQTAEENSKYMIGGSDAHRSEDVAGSGVISETEIVSAQEFIDMVKSGRTAVYKRCEDD